MRKNRAAAFLEWFWDLIDISENLQRTNIVVRQTENGLISGLNAFVFWVLFIVALAFAWTFDFQATIEGLEAANAFILPTLPEAAVELTALIVFSLTLAPTLMEIFTAPLAKANIRIIQLMTIGFVVFDLLTDIPRTVSWMNTFQPQLDLLPHLVAIGMYWFVFILWLFFATLGFELATVIFLFAALAYTKKALTKDEDNRARAAR